MLRKIFLVKLVVFFLVGTVALTGTAIPNQPLPRVEAATFNVNSLADPGVGTCNVAECTLREAIVEANATVGPDVINFDPSIAGGTITLTGELAAGAGGLTINGSGITLDGNNTTRVMYVDPSATVILNNLNFQNGSALFGGAIYNGGGTLTINDSPFNTNTVTSTGGAIYNNGTLTITSSPFNSNSATSAGGAIRNNGTLTITSSPFSGNSADYGGAITNGGTLTIISSTFSGNSAAFEGGAIINYDTLDITDSTFSGNSAASTGGAINNYWALDITNSTFSGNLAASGGAIGTDGALDITSSTFSGNSASLLGGTLYNLDTINAESSLLVGGDCFGGAADGGHNLHFNATGCPGTEADPQLGSLGPNGGPTETILPAPTGPAVDAYAAPCATLTDQRGVVRPQGPSCDIGATEQDGSVMLAASAVCVGDNLVVNISAGDDPFDIAFNGATQMMGVGTGTQQFNGPDLFQNVTVSEQGGDQESTNLGTFNCGTPGVSVMPLTVSVDETGPTSDSYEVVLDSSPDAGETVTVTAGGFDNVLGVTVAPASLAFDDTNWSDPQSFTVTAVDDAVAEADPHTDTITHSVSTTGGAYASVSAASVTASITDNEVSVAASATCNGPDLEVVITAGDGPFDIAFSGATQSSGVSTGTYLYVGPNLFQNVTVSEQGGDQESTNLGTFNCGTPGVTINPTSVAVDETGPTSDTYEVVLDSSPNAGETVTITASGFDTVLGVTVAPTSRAFDSTNWSIPQSFTVTAVADAVTEADPHTDIITHGVSTTGGAYASVSASSVTVSITDDHASLTVSAACNGPDLEVTITSGEGPFNITASAGVNTPVLGVGFGTTTINGPEKWDDLTVTETGGNEQSINLGQLRCRSDERPTPLMPAHRSRTTNAFPLFAWTGITGANNYRVFVFDDANLATRTVDIRQNSGGSTDMNLTVPLPDGRLFWRARGRQNRIWSLWSIRFTLFKDPTPPLIAPTPVPTIDLNPPPMPTVGPVGIPTFPAPPNSR